MPGQREILIERLMDARRQLTSLVDQAPTDKFIYPRWTIKQYIDHISGWDDAIVEALDAHAHGQSVPQTVARGINAYNAQTVETRETLDLVHSRREFAASHERVIQALRRLPDEKLNEPFGFPWGESGTLGEFIEIFLEHDREHADHLTAWLKNPDRVVGEH